MEYEVSKLEFISRPDDKKIREEMAKKAAAGWRFHSANQSQAPGGGTVILYWTREAKELGS